MKRFASIDFLRGLAILMMLVLHIISDVLDLDALLADMGNLSVFELLLLIVLPFLGGLAGFFLMISAIGNMISMQNQLRKGISTKNLALRQVMGGILLLIFAFLTEGILGYHGYIGEIFKHLNDLSQINNEVILYRGYYFETIHTIAWCIIINGFVHALLTRDGKWKDFKKLAKMYFILAVVVLILTPVMWWLADLIVPGYPYAINPSTGRPVQFGVLGQSSFGELILLIFLAPLAAMWEPVFPYLAASFLASIIGIYLAQEPKDIDGRLMKKILKIGLVMFIIGAIGLIANLVAVIMQQDIDAALGLYINISEHRYWIPEHGAPYLGWLFQFLLLNGFGICAIVMIIRLVEFRGKGKSFAEKTVFIRRLGFVAFTMYTMQFIYNGMFFIVSSIVREPYQRLSWGPTLTVLALSLGAFYVLTWAWEKIGYIGSLEWMIGTIASYLIPGKKADKAKKWWERGQLDVEGAFYNAEWLNIIGDDETYHASLPESRLTTKIGWLGFLFFPFSFVTYKAAKNAAQTEGSNDLQRKGQKLGLSGILFFLIWLVTFASLTLSAIGISL